MADLRWVRLRVRTLGSGTELKGSEFGSEARGRLLSSDVFFLLPFAFSVIFFLLSFAFFCGLLSSLFSALGAFLLKSRALHERLRHINYTTLTNGIHAVFTRCLFAADPSSAIRTSAVPWLSFSFSSTVDMACRVLLCSLCFLGWAGFTWEQFALRLEL